MQRVIPENRLQDVRTRLLEEIKATKKRKHPVNHPLFNLTMQNKIDHTNRILRLIDQYPNMTILLKSKKINSDYFEEAFVKYLAGAAKYGEQSLELTN